VVCSRVNFTFTFYHLTDLHACSGRFKSLLILYSYSNNVAYAQTSDRSDPVTKSCCLIWRVHSEKVQMCSGTVINAYVGGLNYFRSRVRGVRR
jgi:hypothetical protein